MFVNCRSNFDNDFPKLFASIDIVTVVQCIFHAWHTVGIFICFTNFGGIIIRSGMWYVKRSVQKENVFYRNKRLFLSHSSIFSSLNVQISRKRWEKNLSKNGRILVDSHWIWFWLDWMVKFRCIKVSVKRWKQKR